MQVNQNVPVRTLYMIRLIAAIMFAVVVIGLILTFVQTGRYERTQGTVVDVRSMARMNSVSNGQIVHYIEYAYEVQGQTFRGSVRTFFPGRRREGDAISVYYDPQNPQKTQDLFIREGLIIGVIFTGVFLAALQKIIALRRRM